MPVAKRRSVTMDTFVESSINTFRAGAMLKGLNYDFTTLINAFAEYGLLKARENTNDLMLVQVLQKYLDYDELREHGLVDEWKDFQEFKDFKQKQKNKSL